MYEKKILKKDLKQLLEENTIDNIKGLSFSNIKKNENKKNNYMLKKFKIEFNEKK